MANASAVPSGANITRISYNVPPCGYCPSLCSPGRQFVGSLTHVPDSARLLETLADEPSLSTLEQALQHDGQLAVSNAAQIGWVLEALALLLLVIGVPVACLVRRKRSDPRGLFLALTVVTFVCQAALLMLFVCIVGSRGKMLDALTDELPGIYSWIFETIGAYVVRTTREMIAAGVAASPNQAADIQDRFLGEMNDTQHTLQLIRSNLSNFDERFDVYKSVVQTVHSTLLIPMAALGLAVGLTALACLAGLAGMRQLKSRKASLFGPTYLLAGVLLLVYNLVALPCLIYLLPSCAVGQGYFCGPYVAEKYAVLDDGMQRLWPTQSRHEPYSHLVPSAVLEQCAKPGTSAQDVRLDRPKTKSIWVPEYEFQKAGNATGNASEPPVGDCVVIHNIITTGMTALCFLFVNELLGYWSANVTAVIICFIAAVMAFLLASLFLGAPAKRKRRRKRKRKASPPVKQPSPTQKPPPPPPPTTPPTAAPKPAPRPPSPPAAAQPPPPSPPQPPAPPPKEKPKETSTIETRRETILQVPVLIPVPVPVGRRSSSRSTVIIKGGLPKRRKPSSYSTTVFMPPPLPPMPPLPPCFSPPPPLRAILPPMPPSLLPPVSPARGPRPLPPPPMTKRTTGIQRSTRSHTNLTFCGTRTPGAFGYWPPDPFRLPSASPSAPCTCPRPPPYAALPYAALPYPAVITSSSSSSGSSRSRKPRKKRKRLRSRTIHVEKR